MSNYLRNYCYYKIRGERERACDLQNTNTRRDNLSLPMWWHISQLDLSDTLSASR